MEYLERIFDLLTFVFGGIARGLERGVTSVFGSSNARYLKKLQPTVDKINAQEAKYWDKDKNEKKMTDAELKAQTDEFRKQLQAGKTLDDLLVDAFAVCREAGRRVLGMRHYDVQLMGGMVLHSGAIAEMVTGEGKTLVATLPAYLNALGGKSVHVVTVNDYLARRDMEWMGPLYMSLGLTVGAIQSHMPTSERQKAYECDITYGTNNEFGFDYLRDNMRPAAKGDPRYPKEIQQVQGQLHYAIIDEVDNILIDEARTPLIISGPAEDNTEKYSFADQVARKLRGEKKQKTKTEEERERQSKKNRQDPRSAEENGEGNEEDEPDFIADLKDHTAHLTDGGTQKAQALLKSLIEKQKERAGSDERRRKQLQQMYNGESFYTAQNMQWPHLIDNSLKAHHLYKLDVNYVIQKDEVVIVDEFTGRLMPGRNWSDGLHQAVEAKEGVRIKKENQTLATITLQNFFKLYDKLCGMTGTAMTEAGEFWKIYKLDVIAVPTNVPLRRQNNPDVIYRSEREKYTALVEEIERMHKWDVLVTGKDEERWGRIIRQDDDSLEFQPKGTKRRETIPRSAVRLIEPRGRPILVGTVSIERSELIAGILKKKGVPHEVLNAKHHQREADVVAQAGRKGAVTIATNMAGRGTDIVLGGNPEAKAWAQLKEKYPTRLDVPPEEWETLVNEIEQREQMKAEGREVAKMGGLHIVGTERHDARRIDLQLRGRCGRQGDPGSSRFYLSLEDDLMRIFAGEWVKNILTRLGMEEGQAIESRMVSRRIEGAQKKVEERNFEVRKNLLEYDEVMDEQRKRVYGYRQRILNGADCKGLVLDMIREQISHQIDQFLAKDYGAESFAEWAGKRLSVELDARDFRNMDLEMAETYAKDQAERLAEGQVLEFIEENLPQDVDPREWNWEALAKAVNTRWQLSLRERDLKEAGREGVGDLLIEKAQAAIQKTDLSDGARYLYPDFGIQRACAWVDHKFGIRLARLEVRGLEPHAFKRLVRRRAEAAYHEREIEFPVMAGLYHFTTRDAAGHKRYNRERLVAWARERFQMELELEDFKNKQRHEINALLIERSRRFTAGAPEAMAGAQRRVAEILDANVPGDQLLRAANDRSLLRELSTWLSEGFGEERVPDEMLAAGLKPIVDQVAAAKGKWLPEVQWRVARVLEAGTPPDELLRPAHDAGLLRDFSEWLGEHLNLQLAPEEMLALGPAALVKKVGAASQGNQQPEAHRRLWQILETWEPADEWLRAANQLGLLRDFSEWLAQHLDLQLAPEDMLTLGPKPLVQLVASRVLNRSRGPGEREPELRRQLWEILEAGAEGQRLLDGANERHVVRDLFKWLDDELRSVLTPEQMHDVGPLTPQQMRDLGPKEIEIKVAERLQAMEASGKSQHKAHEAQTRLWEILRAAAPPHHLVRAADEAGVLRELRDWLSSALGVEVTHHQMLSLRPCDLVEQVAALTEGAYAAESQRRIRQTCQTILARAESEKRPWVSGRGSPTMAETLAAPPPLDETEAASPEDSPTIAETDGAPPPLDETEAASPEDSPTIAETDGAPPATAAWLHPTSKRNPLSEFSEWLADDCMRKLSPEEMLEMGAVKFVDWVAQAVDDKSAIEAQRRASGILEAGAAPEDLMRAAEQAGLLGALADWMGAELGVQVAPEEMLRLGPSGLLGKVDAVDDVHLPELRRRLWEVLRAGAARPLLGTAHDTGLLEDFSQWLAGHFGLDLGAEEMLNTGPKKLVRRLEEAIEVEDHQEKGNLAFEAQCWVAGILEAGVPPQHVLRPAYYRGLVDDLCKWIGDNLQLKLRPLDMLHVGPKRFLEIVGPALKQHDEKAAECRQRVWKVLEASAARDLLDAAQQCNLLHQLCDWLADEMRYPRCPTELLHLPPERFYNEVAAAAEEKFRPEMRKMERALVLQLLDTAWKDHLLAMDHLRSSVGLRGYAQVDPKVEYKREGMRTFENMWRSVGERVTDLVFRMEELDERFVGSTWTEAEAIHEEATSASEIASQQQAAIDGTQADRRREPYRNLEKRVGRNDPCPCKSGRKYKKCCGRKR